MKVYLKMPLGFKGGARWFGEAMKEDMAGVGDVLVVAAVHAIDSHDELVAEVERLTKECNQLTDQLFEADAMVRDMQDIIDNQ